MGDKVLLRLQRDISDNLALHKFWKPLTNLDLPDLAFETLQAAVERLRAAARGLLEVKSGRILDAVEPGAEFETAVTSWGQAASAVRDYNRAVGEIAAAVAGLKARGGTDAGVLGSRLDRLRGAKARHSEVASGLCDQYAEAGKAKKALEVDKKTAKRRLEEYTATVFGTYQSKINELLGQFNAGFRIADTKGRFVGGSPSSSFVLVINNEHVVLDDDKAGGGSPCFKNTLSAGDRSALAFAFFLARLHDDPGIGDKIVVIDDPITSQDSFRTTCTRQLIVRLYSRAKKVIVLSHNQAFLRNLWENMVTRDVKPLRIGRDGDQSTIAEWDIECDTRGVYLQNYHDLAAYLTDGTGERRHVARCIRVLLEEYFRMKAPRHFPRTEWLGYFIDKVRGAKPGEELHAAQHLLAELEDINGYSKRYHHADNPGADSEQVDDTELQGFVRRTIALVSRF